MECKGQCQLNTAVSRQSDVLETKRTNKTQGKVRLMNKNMLSKLVIMSQWVNLWFFDGEIFSISNKGIGALNFDFKSLLEATRCSCSWWFISDLSAKYSKLTQDLSVMGFLIVATARFYQQSINWHQISGQWLILNFAKTIISLLPESLKKGTTYIYPFWFPSGI